MMAGTTGLEPVALSQGPLIPKGLRSANYRFSYL
jgi:hypothetical protein